MPFFKGRVPRSRKSFKRPNRRASNRRRQSSARTLAAKIRSVARAQNETKTLCKDVDEQKIVIGQDHSIGFFNPLYGGTGPTRLVGTSVDPVSFKWQGYIRPVGAYIEGKNGIVGNTNDVGNNNDQWSENVGNASDIYTQQHLVRIIFAHQKPNVQSGFDPTQSAVLPVSDSRLFKGNGDVAVGRTQDYRDLLRNINWDVTVPFYDKTFFFGGAATTQTTKPINVFHRYKPTDTIKYNVNAALEGTKEYTPVGGGIVMYVFTRYANDDYPSFLQAMLPDGVTQIIGGRAGAAPDVEICGESCFKYKDS